MRKLIVDFERNPAAVSAGVAALAVLVYANSLANGFAYDDQWIIQTRGIVQGFGQLGQLLTADYWPDRFGSGLYRPLTLLSFAVDWSLWGGEPFGFHLTNVVLHAGVSALLALLIFQFFPGWPAAVGGAVFAVHPVHTEAVANVVGRGELLAAFFAILACLIYARAARQRPFSWPTIVLICLCYAMGMLSKEVGVVTPILLLATDIPAAAAGRASPMKAYVRSRLPLMILLGAVLVGYFALRWAILGAPVESVLGHTFAPDSSFATRLFTMARVWPRYFELLLFPLQLSADYSPAVILPATGLTLTGLVGFLLVASTVLLAVFAFRRAPEITLAIAWAAVSILPVSNLIVVAEIALAERTLYLPSVAISLIVALALARSPARSRRLLVAAAIAWMVGFSAVTVRRNPVWMSTETVFADLQQHHPESARLLWWLGDRRIRMGDWEGAEEWYRRSLEVWPYFGPYLAEFALQLERHGQLEEAETMAARAVQLDPENREYNRLLGLIRFQRGDYHGVVRLVEEAEKKIGADEVLHALEADALAALEDFAGAARAQAASIRLRGARARWQDWFRLARFHAAAGDTAAALADLGRLRGVAGADRSAADSLERALRGLN